MTQAMRSLSSLSYCSFVLHKDLPSLVVLKSGKVWLLGYIEGYHQPIQMKLCLSHYSHESMPDAKFESGRFSIFGDIMSQNFSLDKGTSHRFRLLTHGKWVKLKKVSFYVKNRYPLPNIDLPHVDFSNF